MRPTIAGPVLAAAVLVVAGGFPGDAAGGPDGTGPRIRVTAFYPGTNVQDVATDTVAFRCNVPVDPATVTTATVRVIRAGADVPGTPVAGFDLAGRPDARTILWTPDEPLLAWHHYTVRLGRTLRSAGGRFLEDPFVTYFTVAGTKAPGVPAPAPASARLVRTPALGPPPRVQWTFPQAGLGNVFSDEVRIRFDRPMDPASLGQETFQVLLNGKEVPGEMEFDEDWDSREIVFRPTLPLYRDTTYEARVGVDARTRRGRHLREEFRAGFGTSPFKGGIRPLREEDFFELPVAFPLGRAFHTATVLPNGDILFAGGQDLPGRPLATAFLYRSTGTLLEIAPMNEARRKHAAVATRDGGVMVLGGFGNAGTTLDTVEIYHPATDTWTYAPSMAVSRANHTATVLASTRILVVGGYTRPVGGVLDYAPGAEVYNQFTSSWAPTSGPPVDTRGGHTATLLPGGRVFLAGGNRSFLAIHETYNPVTGIFTATGSPQEWRLFHAAALTKSGGVLLAGGGPAAAEVYDPVTDSHSPAGSSPPIGLPVTESPQHATLTLVPGGGRIALIGGLSLRGAGIGGDLVLAQVQVWDPAGGGGKGAFYPMPFDLFVPRAGHTVTPTPAGPFLIAGGLGTNGLENERALTLFTPSQ
jgi:hypothetical protein